MSLSSDFTNERTQADVLENTHPSAALRFIKSETARAINHKPIPTCPKLEMLEIEVREATQTHEITYHRKTHAFYATQPSEAVLLKIDLNRYGDDRGKLSGRYHVFSCGIGIRENADGNVLGLSEPHHVSVSSANDGQWLWLTLQIPGLLILVDVQAFETDENPVKKVIRMPNQMKHDRGIGKSIGSPHALIEDVKGGRLYVALKGPSAANPAGIRELLCRCCDEQEHARNFVYPGVAKPENFAIWSGNLEAARSLDTNEQLEDTTYECLQSPAMIAVDPRGNVFASQDANPSFWRLNQGGNLATTEIPYPAGNVHEKLESLSGPAIVSTPQGDSVWGVLLGHNASIYRVDTSDTSNPEIIETTLHHFPTLRVNRRGVRFIHMAFGEKAACEDANPTKLRMYVLATSLLEGADVCDAVLSLEFNAGWHQVVRIGVVELPASKCQAHRVIFCRPGKFACLAVTESSASKVVQIMNPETIPMWDVDVQTVGAACQYCFKDQSPPNYWGTTSMTASLSPNDLCSASRDGDFAMVGDLIIGNVDVDTAETEDTTPLWYSAQEGYIAVLQCLIASRASVDKADEEGATPVFISAQHGRVDVLKHLVTAKADVDKPKSDGATPLKIAAEKGHTEVVQALIAERADVDRANNTGGTPVSWAAYSGHTAVVQALTDAGADVDKADNEGFTPVNAAALYGHHTVAQALIAARADLHQTAHDGFSPLLCAAQEGHDLVVQALLAGSADAGQAIPDGATPVSISAQKGHVAVLKQLVTAKADVDKPRNDGAAPLYMAVCKNHTDIVRMLLAAKAGTQCKYQGVTPLRAAKNDGQQFIAQLLQAAGAQE